MKNVYWLALTLVFFFPVAAYGCGWESYSYVRDSPDGKYLFVMRAPYDIESDFGAEVKKIFPASGMYLNDVSKTPLWTVDWYAHEVIVFSDGIHVARINPWATDTSQEAIAFFANGKMLRSYQINDLIDTVFSCDQSFRQFRWIHEEYSYPEETLHTYVMTTQSDEKYTFDYTTGEMLTARRPLRAFFVVAGTILLSLALKRFGKRRSAFS